MAVEFAPHTLSSNTDGQYYATASSFSPAGGEAYNGFNGSYTGANQSWLGTGAGTDWLAIDVGSSYVLETYSIRVNTVPEPNRAPKDWTLQGSNDGGTTWSTLDTVTNQTAWSSGEQRDFTCDVATTAYSKFRINITANNGDSTYTQVGELYLQGTITPTPEEKIFVDTGHALAEDIAIVVPLYEGSGLVAHDIVNSLVSSSASSGTVVWIQSVDQKIAVAFKSGGHFSSFGTHTNYALQVFSAEALIFMTNTDGPFTIFSTGGAGVQLRVYGNKLNLLRAGVADMGSASTAFGLGKWHHVGVTYDGTTVRFYLNGVADGTSTTSQTFTNNNLNVGASGSGAEPIGNGARIAYVYAWKDRVLTVTDFAALVTDPYSFLSASGPPPGGGGLLIHPGMEAMRPLLVGGMNG